MSESVPRKGQQCQSHRTRIVRAGEVPAKKDRNSWKCSACGGSFLPTISRQVHNESCREHPLNNLPAWVLNKGILE